ncbi:hypothetical protein M0804_013791 [Polistes exclamans]|nr:hypothetical protein M0804_013791 [Polistes exclamans]
MPVTKRVAAIYLPTNERTFVAAQTTTRALYQYWLSPWAYKGVGLRVASKVCRDGLTTLDDSVLRPPSQEDGTFMPDRVETLSGWRSASPIGEKPGGPW